MSKSNKIREACVRGDRIAALRFAARFFDRSADTQIFKRGMDAFNNPEFYRQLRQDPDQMTADALQLLAEKIQSTSSMTVHIGLKQLFVERKAWPGQVHA